MVPPGAPRVVERQRELEPTHRPRAGVPPVNYGTIGAME